MVLTNVHRGLQLRVMLPHNIDEPLLLLHLILLPLLLLEPEKNIFKLLLLRFLLVHICRRIHHLWLYEIGVFG